MKEKGRKAENGDSRKNDSKDRRGKPSVWLARFAGHRPLGQVHHSVADSPLGVHVIPINRGAMFRRFNGSNERRPIGRSRGQWWVSCLGALVLVGLLARGAHAKAVFDPADTRPAPKVSILTMGPGDQAFFKFGHNAIRITYPGTDYDYVYNFGTFQFDNPTLILDFLGGKFRYWLSVQSFRGTVGHYKAENRALYEQELNLAPFQARALADSLRENAKPENRYYEYDYYRDNCSTRIRDALDDNLGGALRERFQDAGQMTLRDHTLRSTAESFWVYAGLDIAMGAYIDQPESRWGEMFLPERLMTGLQSVVFNGVHGSVPLVKDKRTILEPHGRQPVAARPPDRTLAFLEGGLALGGLLAFLGWEAYRRRLRWARVTLSVLTGGLGLGIGILGTLFVLLWAFTNHQVAFSNENILQCSPAALALVVFAIGTARGQLPATTRALKLACFGLGLGVFGLALKVLPPMMQQNYRVMAALIPTWLGLSVGLYFLKRRLLEDAIRPAENAAEEHSAGQHGVAEAAVANPAASSTETAVTSSSESAEAAAEPTLSN